VGNLRECDGVRAGVATDETRTTILPDEGESTNYLHLMKQEEKDYNCRYSSSSMKIMPKRAEGESEG
jgi:hypothetical protein